MTADEVYVMLRKYINDSIAGAGAVKGAPCQIKSITKVGDLNTVIFEWEDTDETTHESTMLVYDGAQGDPGTDGTDGVSPTIVVKTSTDTEYVLTITDKLGSYDTPNLRASGTTLGNLLDVDLTGLANGQAIIWDSANSKWVPATPLSKVKVNGTSLTVTDGEVDIPVSDHVITDAQWSAIDAII